MKKFVIKVNGNVYEVEVEEATGVVNTPIATPAPAAAPAPVAAPTPAPAPAPAAAPTPAPAGATVVSAPMPGTILDIKVSAGQSVNAGDVLCVLEAMKMENEIVAPSAGVVAAINTSKGASVNTGDALVSLN